MEIGNLELEHIYRENDKILVLDDLILKDIDEWFKEYDESIIIK